MDIIGAVLLVAIAVVVVAFIGLWVKFVIFEHEDWWGED